MHGQQLSVRTLLTTLVALLVELLRDVFDVLFATSDEVDLLLVALDFDVETGDNTVGCIATSLLNKEGEGADLVKERQS